MAKISLSLASALTQLGVKAEDGTAEDASTVLVMLGCDLLGIEYSEAKRGKSADILSAREAVASIDAMETALKAKGGKLPKVYSAMRAKEQAKIDAAVSSTVPSIITPAMLTAYQARKQAEAKAKQKG